MKRCHAILFLCCTALLAGISLFSTFGYAAQVLYVKNTQVNLRSDPTASRRNIITTVPAETPVELISQQGTWFNVRLPDGREGWMSQWVLTAPRKESGSDVRATETLPLAPQDAPLITPETMILIPGGIAEIGSGAQEIESISTNWNVALIELEDETPSNTIKLNSFYLDQYEVTNAQYNAFVKATRYPPPRHWKGSRYPEGTARHPVTYVSWDAAQAYSRWAGKRLPTAEEWELAARGLHGQRFPWGENFDLHRVNLDRDKGGLAPVGSFADDVSPYSVYDMGGNVMEWTATQYQGNADFFVLKGGAWNSSPVQARGANLTPGNAIYQLEHIGFRCAQSVGRE